MATMINAKKNFIDNEDDLSLDEWDGLLITEWFDADPGALVPASARFGEFKFAHENPAAWDFVDVSMSTLDAMKKIAAEARTNPYHSKTDGKFASRPGIATSEVPNNQSAKVADLMKDTSGNVNNDLLDNNRETDWSNPIDYRMMGMAKVTGLSGPPTHGDVDAAIADGAREIHRGVLPFKGSKSLDAKSSDQIIDEFKTGPYEPGTGNHGSGFYFTTSKPVADYYAKGPVARQGFKAKTVEGGKTMRAALKKDAKVIEFGDLEKLQKQWHLENKANFDHEVIMNGFKARPGMIHAAVTDLTFEPGKFAAMMGYDAIEVPLKYRTDKGYKKRLQKLIGSDDLGNEIVVINRGALIVGED